MLVVVVLGADRTQTRFLDKDPTADTEIAESSIVASSPLMLICPMGRPGLLPTPSRIISSSDHGVP